MVKEGSNKVWPAVVKMCRVDTEEVKVIYVDPGGSYDKRESPWLPKTKVKLYTGQKAPCKTKRIQLAYNALMGIYEASLSKRKKVSANRLDHHLAGTFTDLKWHEGSCQSIWLLIYR